MSGVAGERTVVASAAVDVPTPRVKMTIFIMMPRTNFFLIRLVKWADRAECAGGAEYVQVRLFLCCGCPDVTRRVCSILLSLDTDGILTF